MLVRFLADESLAPALAIDEAESAYENYTSVHGKKRIIKDTELSVLNTQARALQSAVQDYINNSKGAHISRWIQAIPPDHVHIIVQSVLSEAVLDDDLIDHMRLRLLVTSWCANELRYWTGKAKEDKAV